VRVRKIPLSFFRRRGFVRFPVAAQHEGPPMIQAYLRMVAPPGKRAEFLDVLLCLKGPTEVLEECRACWVVQDADNDHALTYFVRWDCQENLAEHFRSERFRRLLPYIDMSVEFPEIDISGLDRLGGLDFLLGVLGVKQADLDQRRTA
jgi:quinol monooxygenase YgiN